jgi:pimeloyl-ACP methyl ester carboxylesterase
VRVNAVARADGRALAFVESGDPAGTPVMLFHGAPGSRLFVPDDVATRAAGVRLLTFDRPGYGRSDPLPDRRVTDTGADVAALLDHLGIDRCALVGWSGGGPFALGTAFALGDRVDRCVLVSAPGPLDEVADGWEQLGDYQRPTAEMARRDPRRSARAIGRHMERFLDDPSSFLGRDDPLVQGAYREMLVAQVTEALAQSTEGLAADLVAMWCDWGFRLAEVTTPTAVFQGATDPHNASAARCYAERIPGASLTIWLDAGHMGVLTHWTDILAAASPDPMRR